MADESEDLVRRLQQAPRDELLWQEFVARYDCWVRGWLRTLVRREDVVAELANDLFLKVYLNLPKFDPARGSLRPWMSTVVVRQVRSWARRRTALPVDPAQLVRLTANDALAELELALDMAEYAGRYRTAIRRLEEGKRFRPASMRAFRQAAEGDGDGSGLAAEAARKAERRVAQATLALMGLPDRPESYALLRAVAAGGSTGGKTLDARPPV